VTPGPARDDWADGPQVIRPDWPLLPGVGAMMSTRRGGVSTPPWDRMNLGAGVGDAATAVAENRSRWGGVTGAQPVWLNQVHGTRVVRLGDGDGDPGRDAATADAAWTDRRGLACTVLVADCLPVLLAGVDGRAVAAAHAGWRGLAGGVLEATLAALRDGAGLAPADVVAWLGPCIGPRTFEVGLDVLQAFDAPERDDPRFISRPRADGSPRWLADLQALARGRLREAGVLQVYASDLCTVENPSGLFSFRRDGITGRMAASIWRR
jgi:polyphenol oxidase